MNLQGTLLTEIKVTNANIRKGGKADPRKCPIALTLKRLLQNKTEVWVSGDTVKIDKSFNTLPTKASRFIKAFDTGKSVQPFSFQLAIPAQRLRPNILQKIIKVYNTRNS